MIKFNSSRHFGIDVSQFNDYANTSKKPDLKAAAKAGAEFGIYRSSYGRVEDPLFKHYFDTGAGSLLPAMYHYEDYYSHTCLNLNSTQWGIQQGKFVYSLWKDRKCPIFIDVESASASIARNISLEWNTAMTILDNILKTLDDLTGSYTGIYASTGWLNKFYVYQRTRPLFAANYNKYTPDGSPMSVEYILKLVKGMGYTDPCIFQYRSDGDIDADGDSDARMMGMENTSLDLNVWIGTEERYREFFGVKNVPTSETPVVIDTPKPAEPSQSKAFEVKHVKPGITLKVRTSKSTPTLLSVVAPERITAGEEVTILERRVSGKYTWVRIGWRQWICEEEDGVAYLE